MTAGSAALFALALAAQTAGQQTLEPPDPVAASREGDTAQRLRLQELNTREPSPEARLELQNYGVCIARNSPDVAAQTLRSDFTAPGYRLSLNRLISANDGCFGRRGYRMRFPRELLTAALAEAMVERDPTPLNVRLARAALQPAVAPFSTSDRVALCVVRSLPDETAALLASDVGGDGEVAAARALVPAVQACAQTIGVRVEISDAGLRATLASAAFRTADTLSTASAQAQ